MKPKRHPDAMTGDDFRSYRVGTFRMTQAEFAELLGLNLRTVVSYEATFNRKKDIPLPIAKLIRLCEIPH